MTGVAAHEVASARARPTNVTTPGATPGTLLGARRDLPDDPASRGSPNGTSGATPNGTLDYDVHGVLGVRLVDAAPADVRAAERHLRGFRRPLGRAPDLVVRFVDHLPADGLGCVDVERSAYGSQGYQLRGAGARAGWVRVPFEQLGEACELVAERGVGQIPYFKPMLRLAALHRGYVPLHASAFALDGAGVVVTGWTHGGKTSALLAFAEHGARFVGDDLVLLAPDGARMYGLGTPLNVSAAQLRQSGRLRRHVGRCRYAALAAFDRADRAEARLGDRWPAGAASLAVLRKATRPIRRRVGVHLPPERAFWNGVEPSVRPRTLFLMTSQRAAAVRVEPADPVEVAERMLHSMRFEDLALFGEYLAFRFAFPQAGCANARIEAAHELARARLRQAVAGLDAYVVRHPYPAPLRALYDAMRPFCAGDAAHLPST